MKPQKMFRGYDFVENGIYPDDFFSYPKKLYIDNFSHMASVGLTGDLYENSVNFAYNSLKLTGTGSSYTEWSFCAVSDRRAEVNISFQLYRLPKKLTFEVTAAEGEISDAVLGVSTLGWKRVSELTSRRYEIPAEKDSAEGKTVFDLEKFFADHEITLPITDLSLSFAAKAGAGCRFELRGVYAEFDVRPADEVEIYIPSEITAGKDYPIGIDLWELPEQVLDLEFRHGKYVYYRERFFRDDLKLGAAQYERVLPEWLAREKYTVTVSRDGIRTENECATAVTGDASKGFPDVRRETNHGRTAVFVDGKPFPWTGFASYDYVPGSVNDFGNNGINLFCIPVACGQHIHAHVADPTILGENRYDYGQTDERVGFSLQSNPEAMIMLRVNLLLPRSWIEAHPDCKPLVYRNGKLLAWAETSGVEDISLMCPEWLADQTAELEKLLSYCESRPWGNRVIAIMISGEVTEEWFAWAANSEGAYYGDYSIHGISAFKKWLEENRPGTDTAVSGYTVPLPEQRKFPGARFKPDTAEGRLAAAYSEFLNDFTAGVICRFAHAVKKASHGRLLAGSLYGYVIQLAGDGRQSTAGHMGLEKYLNCDDIDYICGIPWLNHRDPVNGYDTFVSAAESVYAHGKLVINENDSFSVFHPFIWHRHYPGETPDDVTGGAGLMHRSTFAYDFVRGNPRQYFSLMATWHYAPGMQAVISDLARIGRENISADIDRTGCEEVAFMVDDHSYAWAEETSDSTRKSVSDVLYAAGRTGAPVGTWILSDIDRLPDRIKTVVITNALCPTVETAEKVSKAVAKGGRTFVIVGDHSVYNPVSGRKNEDSPDPYLSAESECREETSGSGPKIIYCPEPPVSVDELRGLFEKSGVHFYVPVGNYCHASEETVSVTAGSSGVQTVTFRYDADAEDLYTGEKASGREQQWNFAAGQTRLFVLKHR